MYDDICIAYLYDVSHYLYEICIVVHPIALEVSLNLNLQLNPLDLFSTERGERDLENQIIDGVSRLEKWHSKCNRLYVYVIYIVVCVLHMIHYKKLSIGWLRLGGSLKLQFSFAKEPYKRHYILQRRLIILRSLLIVAAP